MSYSSSRVRRLINTIRPKNSETLHDIGPFVLSILFYTVSTIVVKNVLLNDSLFSLLMLFRTASLR